MEKNNTVPTAIAFIGFVAIFLVVVFLVRGNVDKNKIESAFLATVGTEYLDIWKAEHLAILLKAKMKFGSDMSTWSITDLSSLQKMYEKGLVSIG